jgi:predicted glycosyl hydrolase (DUF1957 family)
MQKIHIGLMLHLYQPPTQPDAVLSKIIRECYEPLMRLLADEQISLSADIAASLGARLPSELRAIIKTACAKNKLEIVNTAAYHPLLPIVPREIARRQLRLNADFYRAHFSNTPPVGVWPPELAVSPELPELFAETGHRWCVADDTTFTYHRMPLMENRRSPNNWIPEINGCAILLRSHLWSETIANMRYPGPLGYYDGPPIQSGEEFLEKLILGQQEWMRQCKTSSGYVILALDGETFGHHHKNTIETFLLPFFRKAAEQADMCAIAPLGTIVSQFEKINMHRITLPKGTWSTSHKDMRNQIPYPLWQNPDNQFHVAWNHFMHTVFTEQSWCVSGNTRLQELLDSAFYSCSPWQAVIENNRPKDPIVAGWCIPLFEEIIQLANPAQSVRESLLRDIRAMRDFLSRA